VAAPTAIELCAHLQEFINCGTPPEWYLKAEAAKSLRVVEEERAARETISFYSLCETKKSGSPEKGVLPDAEMAVGQVMKHTCCEGVNTCSGFFGSRVVLLSASPKGCVKACHSKQSEFDRRGFAQKGGHTAARFCALETGVAEFQLEKRDAYGDYGWVTRVRVRIREP
jgi:hypothetical protein